jgi:hypothetical protein
MLYISPDSPESRQESLNSGGRILTRPPKMAAGDQNKLEEDASRGLPELAGGTPAPRGAAVSAAGSRGFPAPLCFRSLLRLVVVSRCARLRRFNAFALDLKTEMIPNEGTQAIDFHVHFGCFQRVLTAEGDRIA